MMTAANEIALRAVTEMISSNTTIRDDEKAAMIADARARLSAPAPAATPPVQQQAPVTPQQPAPVDPARVSMKDWAAHRAEFGIGTAGNTPRNFAGRDKVSSAGIF